jgi:hypothetical protein
VNGIRLLCALCERAVTQSLSRIRRTRPLFVQKGRRDPRFPVSPQPRARQPRSCAIEAADWRGQLLSLKGPPDANSEICVMLPRSHLGRSEGWSFRSAARRGRRPARPRPGNGAATQPHHRERDAVFPAAERARHRGRLRFRRLSAIARQGVSAHRHVAQPADRRQIGRRRASCGQFRLAAAPRHLLRGPRAAVPAPLSSQGQALAKARSATSAVDPDGEATPERSPAFAI